MQRVDLRTITAELSPEELGTKDNMKVNVGGSISFSVVDPAKAVLKVENFFGSTIQFAKTLLKNLIAEKEAFELTARISQLQLELHKKLDTQTEAWGVKVTSLEIRRIDS